MPSQSVTVGNCCHNNNGCLLMVGPDFDRGQNNNASRLMVVGLCEEEVRVALPTGLGSGLISTKLVSQIAACIDRNLRKL